MDLQEVMAELKALGTERTKKIYQSHGAKEPLFGVTTGAMKPLARKIKKDYALSMALYDTGNYDAAYFAGMIAEPQKMSQEDFEVWIQGAYFYMLSDYVAAVTLAETDFAQEVADRWIESDEELRVSAGWSCYCWLLGTRDDSWFDHEKLAAMLIRAGKTIHSQPNRVRYAMNNFVIAAGISYLPLHTEAVRIAEQIGSVSVNMGTTSCKTPNALQSIQKAESKGRLGFKRKNVRC